MKKNYTSDEINVIKAIDEIIYYESFWSIFKLKKKWFRYVCNKNIMFLIWKFNLMFLIIMEFNSYLVNQFLNGASDDLLTSSTYLSLSLTLFLKD